jgi:HK97 family phage portal protein
MLGGGSLSILDRLFKRKSSPEENTANQQDKQGTFFKMVEGHGGGFYSWGGKLYKSDVVRSCIRPQVKSIGALVAKHVRDNGTEIKTNPDNWLKFLLTEPNPHMTGQILQERLANQLALNGNAFAVIIRNDVGYPCGIYPVSCWGVDAVKKGGQLHLKFYFPNGKNLVFPYSDIIHLRDDFCEDNLFGESPMSALSPLMEVISTIDQGIVKAVKNSGAVRWLLKFTDNLRPDDLQKRVKEFTENYLSIDNDTVGAAGTDYSMDAQRIEPKDYVPNAAQTDRNVKRIMSFFNVNEKIIQSDFTEDERTAYMESRVKPYAMQLGNEFTRKIFSRRARAAGNLILFDTSDLQYASLSTKLNLVSMVDRGALTPNEWRKAFNFPPIEGGDKPLRRLDTQPISEGVIKKGGDD